MKQRTFLSRTLETLYFAGESGKRGLSEEQLINIA